MVAYVTAGSMMVIRINGITFRANVSPSNTSRSSSPPSRSDSLLPIPMLTVSLQLLLPRVATPRSTSHALRHQQPKTCETSTSVSEPVSRRVARMLLRRSGNSSSDACSEAVRCLIRREGCMDNAGNLCSCAKFQYQGSRRYRIG